MNHFSTSFEKTKACMLQHPAIPLSLFPVGTHWHDLVEDQVEQTEGQLEEDEQKFHKKLLNDEAQLEDKLDNLQVCRHWWKVSSLTAKLLVSFLHWV